MLLLSVLQAVGLVRVCTACDGQNVGLSAPNEACWCLVHMKDLRLLAQVGIAILYWEYNRQAGKDVEKKLKDEQFRQAVLQESRAFSQQQLQVCRRL